jgi:aminopeptidase
VYTGPVEDSVDGWVNFTYPAIRLGHEVSGIKLKFEAGKVVEASAAKNQAFLMESINTDPGASYVGEFAIGTNYGIQRHTGNILFDEKIGGSFHMALGSGYPETGSKNDSAIHWDMICDMKKDSQISVDGNVIYKDGRFTF